MNRSFRLIGPEFSLLSDRRDSIGSFWEISHVENRCYAGWDKMVEKKKEEIFFLYQAPPPLHGVGVDDMTMSFAK